MFTPIGRELLYQMGRPRRLLFDHLPKCAGTTVNEYLTRHYPQRLLFRMHPRQPRKSVHKFYALPLEVRHQYRLILGHSAHRLLEHVHPETLAFTIFRDPIERIVSHYFFVKRDKQHYLHGQVMSENLSLLDYATGDLSPELRNWYVTHFTGLTAAEAEQHPETSVQQAFDIIQNRYQLIGFQDDLPGAIAHLRQTVGLLLPFRNPMTNRTQKHHDVIAPDVQAAIAAVNGLDVQLYERLRSANRSLGS